MEDGNSVVKYFFGNDENDIRGIQIAKAMSDPDKFEELISVRNFVTTSTTVAKRDYEVHPDVSNFFIDVGIYHRKIQGGSIQSIMSDVGTNFVKNVIEKYNELPEWERKFFDKYMHAIPTSYTRGQPNIPTKNLGDLKPDDYASHKLNLRKFMDNSTDNEIFWTELNKLSVSLSDSYRKGRNGEVTAGDPIASSPSTGFGIELGKFLGAALRHIKQKQEVIDDASLPETTIFDFATQDIIDVRNGQLIRKENGKVQPITDVSNLKSTDACYGTQLNVNGSECRKFISDVLLNDDSEAFNKWFGDNSINDSVFNLKSREEIAKINPEIAIAILTKFGFKKVPSILNGREISKFQNVADWIKSLPNNISIATRDKITRAKHLRDYLSALVGFVNGNPAILNSGFSSKPIPEEQDKNSYLCRTGIKYMPRIPMGEPESNDRDAIMKIAKAANAAHRLATQPPLFRMIGFPAAFGMRGGAPSGSVVIKRIINGLIEDLSRNGKQLTKSDVDAINKHIDTLTKTEQAITKIASQLSEYKEWIELLPKKQELVSIGSIESSLDKYRSYIALHAKLENGLIDVITKLSTL